MTVFSQKLIFTTALCLLCGLGAPSATQAWFADTETSETTVVSAGILALELSATTSAVSISTEENSEVSFSTEVSPVQDSLAMQYTVSMGIGTTSPFCDELSVVAKKEGITEYSGALLALYIPPSTVFGEWEFTLSIPSNINVSAGDACVTDIRFLAWRDNAPTVTESGFFGEEFLELSVTAVDPVAESADIVLNEFLPRPDGVQYGFDFGDDNDDKPQGEWVELYNTTDTPADLTGWYITDENGGEGNTVVITAANLIAHISPETTIIPANGYLTIYMNKATLNNTSDTVKLYNSSGVLVDSYQYGDDPTACTNEPTEGDENEDSRVGSCDASNVPANKSFARIPDGGTWVDPIPTPGTPNVATAEDLQGGGWTEDEISVIIPNAEGDADNGTSTPVTGSDENGASSTVEIMVPEAELNTDVSTTTDEDVITEVEITENNNAEEDEEYSDIESVTLPEDEEEKSDNDDLSGTQKDMQTETESESEPEDESEEDIPADTVPDTSTQSEAPVESIPTI